MALVEIDEKEYQASQRVVDTMSKLMGNPATRRMIQEAQKKLNPDLVIPELDVVEAARKENAGLQEQLAALQKSIEDDREERHKRDKLADITRVWETGRGKLRNKGYTDEGLSAVEKFMEDKGIMDHEVAAAAWERLNPPSEPVRNMGGNNFDLFEPDDQASDAMKKLRGNPDDAGALNTLIHDALQSVRGR